MKFVPTRDRDRIERDELCAICVVVDELSIPIVYSIAPEQHTATVELMQHIRERLPSRFFEWVRTSASAKAAR